MKESVTDNIQSIIKLNVDGAARNNPGPAGAGICISKNEELIFCKGYYLGSKTNNEAEYLALLIGLFYAQQFLKKNDILNIVSDSELLVRQISGIYKTKKLELQKIQKLVMLILSNINYKIAHVPRDQNKEADKKANHAIDKKIQIPQDFIEFLNNNDVSFNF